MSLKSLESAFIYKNLNKSNAVSSNIMKLMTDGVLLTKKEVEEAIMVIDKNFKFPLKFKVLDAFEDGTIKLMFGMNSKLPSCLPFFLTKTNGGRVVAIVSVDIYGSYDDETHNVKIDPKKLYCMMESAYIAIKAYEHQIELKNKPILLSVGSNIYSLMFTRVLNKKYSLNIDKSKMHKVIMLSSLFYMVNILGAPLNETTFNYALKNCPNGNVYTLKQTANLFDEDDFSDFETFIKALTRPVVGLNLKDLTVRNYLEAFIGMYESTALLALESFPYFIYNIMSVTNGAYINNQYIMEDIVSNGGSKIYNELLKLG